MNWNLRIRKNINFHLGTPHSGRSAQVCFLFSLILYFSLSLFYRFPLSYFFPCFIRFPLFNHFSLCIFSPWLFLFSILLRVFLLSILLCFSFFSASFLRFSVFLYSFCSSLFYLFYLLMIRMLFFYGCILTSPAKQIPSLERRIVILAVVLYFMVNGQRRVQK